MAIIKQKDSKHTVQLTGKDLEDYLVSRFEDSPSKVIDSLLEKERERKSHLLEEETEARYKIVELDEEFDSYDEAVEFCYQEDIIYYHKAIKYLFENDSSLRESLELANDLGCTLENLSSETLATIHYQNYLIGEIEEI